MSQWAKYSTPDPELAPLLAKLPKFGFDDPIATREKFEKILPGILNATKHELPAGTYLAWGRILLFSSCLFV